VNHGMIQRKKEKFLKAYEVSGNITKAAEDSGITRRDHYDWLKTDPQYVEAFENSSKIAVDALEAEAIRRAHDGVDEPVFYQGQVVGTIRKFSDTLLIFLLKGAKPEKYKERNEHTGPNGTPLLSTLEVTYIGNPISAQLKSGALPINGPSCGIPIVKRRIGFKVWIKGKPYLATLFSDCWD